MPKIRRVITAQTEGGKSIFKVDEDVEPMGVRISHGGANGGGIYWIWATDGLPQRLPIDRAAPAFEKMFPRPDGVHVFVSEIRPVGSPMALPFNAPQVDPSFECERTWDERTQLVTTDSVEIVFVIAGEITLIQDDQEAVILQVGDVLIQNGASHRWRNHTAEPCQLGIVVLGAIRAASEA